MKTTRKAYDYEAELINTNSLETRIADLKANDNIWASLNQFSYSDGIYTDKVSSYAANDASWVLDLRNGIFDPKAPERGWKLDLGNGLITKDASVQGWNLDLKAGKFTSNLYNIQSEIELPLGRGTLTGQRLIWHNDEGLSIGSEQETSEVSISLDESVDNKSIRIEYGIKSDSSSITNHFFIEGVSPYTTYAIPGTSNSMDSDGIRLTLFHMLSFIADGTTIKAKARTYLTSLTVENSALKYNRVFKPASSISQEFYIYKIYII